MAVIGQGKIEYQVGSTFTAIGNAKKITFPSIAVSSIETTHLGITNGHKTFTYGMADPGNVSVEMEYSDAGYTTLSSLLLSEHTFKVTETETNNTLTFTGFLTKLESELDPDAEVMISFDVKVSGLVS